MLDFFSLVHFQELLLLLLECVHIGLYIMATLLLLVYHKHNQKTGCDYHMAVRPCDVTLCLNFLIHKVGIAGLTGLLVFGESCLGRGQTKQSEQEAGWNTRGQLSFLSWRLAEKDLGDWRGH